MAGRIIAQMLVSLTTNLARAGMTAYQQALHNARASGVASSAAMGKTIGIKPMMKVDEACKVFNLDQALVNNKQLTLQQLEEVYHKHSSNNDTVKGGSFYLQSKVYRARETLVKEMQFVADGIDDTFQTTKSRNSSTINNDATDKK